MSTTPKYNDPILTANDINIEAYRETMQRFHDEAAKSQPDLALIDYLLDHRYDVITDDQMYDLGTIVAGTHPVDYNPGSKWPYPNPYGPTDPRR